MPSLGDLSKYLSEDGKISDYSWLDVDPKDYVNTPFNNLPEYVAIPQLEEAWKHLKDTNVNLVPNVDLNYTYKTPDSAPSKEEIEDLVNFVKKQMMLGKNGDNLVKLIVETFKPQTVKASREYLEQLAKEQGLLGNVYIDPKPFNKCHEGAKYLDKKAKLAKYVVEKDKCHDCFYNKKSRCEIYKKAVVKDVPYDTNLFNFYSNHLSYIEGEAIKISSKEDLKKQFLKTKPVVEESRLAQFKPKDASPEVNLDEKKKKFEEDLKELREELSNFEYKKVSKDISLQMLKGYSGRVIKEYIKQKYNTVDFNKNKEAFNEILKKQGSLGRIYVEAETLPFEHCTDARDFFKNNAAESRYLILNPQSMFCKCNNSKTCHNLNKTKISSIDKIPNDVWENELKSYPSDIVNKISSIYNEDKIRGLRLAFLQKDIRNYDPVETENYGLKASSDYISLEPKSNKPVFSSNKVVYALDKGYPISSIIYTAKKMGFEKEEIIPQISEALSKVGSVNKYQLDVNFKLPDSLKIKMSQRDTNLDLHKPLTEKSSSSQAAPSENLINDFDIKNACMKVEVLDNKKDELEIKELNQFNI